MTFEDLLPYLEEEILDPEEETFLLFSRPIPSHNLGFIDPKAQTLDVTISNRDYTIHQSPGILSSNRAGGTTGAVLWKITPLFAELLSSLKNPFFTTGLLHPSSSILELGCGISPLTALAVSPLIPQGHYTLTDQLYVQKHINLNLSENKHPKNVFFRTLDWEEDEVTGDLCPGGYFDMVVAVDCVYNEALVRPLVQTLRDACLLKEKKDGNGRCLAVVAQQLRSDDVFQTWLAEFQKVFKTWRVGEESIPKGLQPDDGFVVHVGLVRGSTS